MQTSNKHKLYVRYYEDLIYAQPLNVKLGRTCVCHSVWVGASTHTKYDLISSYEELHFFNIKFKDIKFTNYEDLLNETSPSV